jgi:hypothetical protein
MHGPIIGPTSPRCHQRFSLAVRLGAVGRSFNQMVDLYPRHAHITLSLNPMRLGRVSI